VGFAIMMLALGGCKARGQSLRNVIRMHYQAGSGSRRIVLTFLYRSYCRCLEAGTRWRKIHNGGLVYTVPGVLLLIGTITARLDPVG
jgi:hypothetical protein